LPHLGLAAGKGSAYLGRRRRVLARHAGSGEMAYFVQQLINGLTLGAIYGLIAIGYTMVYGIIGMINFAHGEVYMIGAFVSLITFLALGVWGITYVPLILVLALMSAMFFTSVYGWTIERVAYRPLRHSFRLAPLISAIGVSILLQNYVQLLQGARVKALQPVVQGGIQLMETSGFTVQISYLQIFIILLTTALMVGFSVIIGATPLGRAQRACEQDMTMASLLGINVDRTISLTFVMGAALAAVAGMMVTLYYGVIDFYIGFLAGVKAFTAAVLGGIGSLPGAMLGGLLIGLIEAMWSGYFSVEYKDVSVFVILVLVLIFRPTGLLGRPDVEKV
jgi:branched-chain amino acid transport system permease protein